jgi:hypothetical protein
MIEVAPEAARTLCIDTIEQAKSGVWRKVCKVRITASKAHVIAHGRTVNLRFQHSTAQLWATKSSFMVSLQFLCSKSPKSAWHVEVIAEDFVMVLVDEDVAKAVEIVEAKVTEVMEDAVVVKAATKKRRNGFT